MKKDSVLRIACPDAEFLYNVTKLGKEYWKWMRYWFDERKIDFEKISACDCLVAEIATPKLKRYGWLWEEGNYEEKFASLDMYAFMEYMKENLSFKKEYVNNHINFWTFDKLHDFLSEVGFIRIIRSKYGGSFNYEMQDVEFFDKTHPEMSLYVEAIRQ